MQAWFSELTDMEWVKMGSLYMRKPRLREVKRQVTQWVSGGAYPPPPGGSSFHSVSLQESRFPSCPSWRWCGKSHRAMRTGPLAQGAMCEHECVCVCTRCAWVCVRVLACAVVCTSSPLAEGSCVTLCTGKRMVNKPGLFTALFPIHPADTVYFRCISRTGVIL